MSNKIVILIGFLCISASIYIGINDNIQHIQEIDDKIDMLTQERTTSWTQANGVPDSIYFISFGEDTTFYIKSREQND